MDIRRQIITRYANELVNETLVRALSLSLFLPTSGTPFPSGSIYVQSPDELYINSRTETVNNLQQNRYPCISILPNDISINKTQDYPIILQESNSATGLVKIWTSDYEIRQNYSFIVESVTKKDHRRMSEQLLHFFNNVDTGIELINEVLPNGFKEHMQISLNDYQQDYSDAPYVSIFETNIHYRMYREELEYLFFAYEVSGSIYIDDYTKDDRTFLVISGSI